MALCHYVLLLGTWVTDPLSDDQSLSLLEISSTKNRPFFLLACAGRRLDLQQLTVEVDLTADQHSLLMDKI